MRKAHSKCFLGIIIGVLVALLFTPKISLATSSFPPPPNVRVTNIPQLNNEEQTAISPVDPNLIISVWRDFRLGYRQVGIGRSINGGVTWTDSLISPNMQYINIITGFANPPSNNWQSDPTLVADRFGNFYISVVDFVANGTAINDSSTISFYKSTDGGLSWTGPVPITPVFPPAFEDKQFITVDNSGGATDGNVYMSWTRFPAPTRIMSIRSTDGVSSFGDTVVVGGIQTSTGCGAMEFSAGQFSIPVVDNNADLHLFWIGPRLDSSSACLATISLKHSVSLDAGVSFSPQDNIQEVSGYTFASTVIETYSQPVVDVDRTSGPFAGNMYLCYTNEGPEDVGHTDVDFMVSADNALTWSSRVQINDGINSSLSDSFHPWMVVNEEGVVIVIFYDNRFDLGIFEFFDLVATYSFDGGLTFTCNHRITDASSSPAFLFSSSPNRQAAGFDYRGNFDPRDAPLLAPTAPQAGMIGEYIGLSALHALVSACWTDTRDLNSEVYNATWKIPLLEPKLISPAVSELTTPSPTFTWATSWTSDRDRYTLEILDFTTFVNIATRTIDTNFNVLDIALADGLYRWRVRTIKLPIGLSSEFSPLRVFQVDGTAPTTVALMAPFDGEFTPDSTPGFDWSDAFDANNFVEYAIDFSIDSDFPDGKLTTTVSGLESSDFTPTNPLPESVESFWRVRASDLVGNTSTSKTFSVTFQATCCQLAGDADNNEKVNIADITFLIARIFANGPAPICNDGADADGNNKVNIADVTFLIARIFAGGKAPICGTQGI